MYHSIKSVMATLTYFLVYINIHLYFEMSKCNHPGLKLKWDFNFGGQLPQLQKSGGQAQILVTKVKKIGSQ